MRLNRNFFNLKDNYLFVSITKKAKDFSKKNPEIKIISLGIGDTTLPLCNASINAMQKAVLELSKKETYRGYGLEPGYLFLREAVSLYYKKRGVNVSPYEIFISEGAGRDIADITELFDFKSKSLIIEPAYPAYNDASIMDGREVVFLKSNEENNFVPEPDKKIDCDIIYLCSPNNPTGVTFDKTMLKKWVDYAIEKNAVVLFDAAYEAFISDEKLPRSIFEIEGAKKCSIEISSLSKTAGFTGVRCSYTVIPKELVVEGRKVLDLWLRRQSTKFNGLSYITQRGAEAVFSKEGQQEIKFAIDYYKENTRIINETLSSLDILTFGSKNSPYVWARCPNDISSWDFFGLLLEKANVIVTPGEGFGESGKNFVRFSGFGDREEVLEAVNRIKSKNLF